MSRRRIKEDLYYPNILIAEDSEDDYIFTERALVDKGFCRDNLVRVTNGVELLKYLDSLEDQVPDLILLDLSMPLKDGHQTLKELKKNKNIDITKIPVVILSNSGTDDDRYKSLDLGANWYIEKPSSLYEYNQQVVGACKYWGITFQRLMKQQKK